MFVFDASRTKIDGSGKAINISFFSFARPHMRAFHYAWISFLLAFIGWLSVPPLMSSIRSSLDISIADIHSSHVTSVSSTIFFRILAGIVCECIGPRRTLAAILLVGSIPVMLAGLVRNGAELIAVRFFSGILGGNRNRLYAAVF